MAGGRGGWGTVEGVRLAVLLLADPERAEAANAVARSLSRGHDVALLAEKRGAIASHLQAANAARQLHPRVVHGVGARGFGAAAAPIARGIGAKLVVSLAPEDLDRCSDKKLARLANGADAVLLDDESLVEPLRRAGMKRTVYILPPPAAPEEDAEYFAATEIVYGRVLDGEVAPACEEEQIVQIGGLKRGPGR
jgi:hypothetical protein